MEDATEKLPVLRITEQDTSKIEDVVVRESALTIIVNNQELVTLLCSPGNLKYLAIGFLLSEGLIEDKNDITNVVIDDQKGVAQIEIGKIIKVPLKPVFASGGGKNTVPLHLQKVSTESQIKLPASQVFSLMENFALYSRVFKSTGGVHSAALCAEDNILVFHEDIGRHNAIDKIFGECLLKNIATSNRLIITSGRVSSEILLKVAKRNIPVLISRSAPTNLGIRLADNLGITLIGFVRGKRMNVYTNSWRVINKAF